MEEVFMKQRTQQTAKKKGVNRDERRMKRNQIIFLLLSFFLILSMLISLIRF